MAHQGSQECVVVRPEVMDVLSDTIVRGLCVPWKFGSASVAQRPCKVHEDEDWRLHHSFEIAYFVFQQRTIRQDL